MARSKKHRKHADKHPWPDAEVDESPFARVTADMVTRGQFSFGSPQADEELQKSRFLASTAGLLVFKGEAAPSSIEVAAEGSALADAIAACRLADEEVHRLRDELAALKAERPGQPDAGSEAARVEADAWIQNLRDEIADLKAALAQQETALAEARQAGQTDADSRERAAQGLADMRERAEAERAEADAQIRTLGDELATLRSALAERDSALTQSTLDHEHARAEWQRESQGSLSSTEQAWKVAEAARFAEAEAKWREDSERSLAELRAQAQAVRDEAERNIKALGEDVAALRSTLADREAALAQAISDHDQARARLQQEGQAALSNAEQAWKTAEAARFMQAEATWKEQSDQALVAFRTEAEKARESAEGTIRGLQEQIQATLADREAALAEAALDTQRTREQARQELDAVLTRMKTLQAEEAQRLAAAEAKWKQQSAAALAEAQARYQTAEGALVTLRLEADRARSNATGGSINAPRSGDRSSFGTGDRSSFGTKAAREPEPAAIRLPTREARAQATPDAKIVLQPHRVLEDAHGTRKRGIGRDLLVVAGLAVVAFVAYPRIEPLIPEPWRSQIAALTGGVGSTSTVAAQGPAIVIRDVNLRVGPSTSTGVVATLSPGLQVTTLGRRDDWTFVEVGSDSRNPQPRRGWVFSSFLRDGADDAEGDDSVEPESSE